MSFLPLLGAGVGVAGDLITDSINYQRQQKMNAQDRAWQGQMYDVQRRDALADWARQTDYNSPQAQMKRFQEAGLNPKLIYGTASHGAAGAVRSSSVGSHTPKATMMPSGIVGNAISAMADLQTRGLSNDLLKKQNQLQSQNFLTQVELTRKAKAEADIAEIEADTRSVVKGADVLWRSNKPLHSNNLLRKQNFEYDMASELRQNSLDVQYQLLKKYRAETGLAESRITAMNTLTPLEAQKLRELTPLQKQQLEQLVENLKKTGQLQENEIQWMNANKFTKNVAPWLKFFFGK